MRVDFLRRIQSCPLKLDDCFTKLAQQFMKGMVIKIFWSIKNAGKILNKLKSRGFLASSLSTYDFSTLYTTLLHNLIKEKLIIN